MSSTTLLPLAHPLGITYRQFTYVHTLRGGEGLSSFSRSVWIVPDRVRAQGIPNGGREAPPTAMPDIADPFSRNPLNSDTYRTPAREDLKRLATRYLCNPDSRVDTLRMGLSPSGGRFMVMIVLEVDDII